MFCKHVRFFTKMANNLKRKAPENASSGAKKPTGPWNMGLKASMEDPELRIEADDDIVIIKDKYPKARHHFLVMPRQSIANLKSLKEDHIPLLRHMEERGKKLAESTSELEFRYGYHAIPSMSHVHLHVISQDFDSQSLKTKKHWNSFTTEYFIDSSDVISMLEKDGKVQVDTKNADELLKKPLRCHRCGEAFKTIPALKQHIVKHIPAKFRS